MVRDEQWVYDGLKSAIGREPRPEIWDELVKLRYVIEAQQGRGNLKPVVEHYRAQDKRYFSVRPRKMRRDNEYDELPDSRLEHLSEIMAWDAAYNQDVIEFRKDALHDQLLSPEEVQGWVEQVERSERSKDAPTVRHEDNGKRLIYGVRDKQWRKKSIPIASGGVLEKLKGISDNLHIRYGWLEAQATVFILTGLKPLLPKVHSTSYLHPFYPALNTISITVSPHLSPKQVADVYTRARANLLGGGRRNRTITEKHLDLAVFYHKHRGKKGSEMRSIWNKEHVDQEGYKPYILLSHFDRDAKHAHDRLVGLVGKGGKL